MAEGKFMKIATYFQKIAKMLMFVYDQNVRLYEQVILHSCSCACNNILWLN